MDKKVQKAMLRSLGWNILSILAGLVLMFAINPEEAPGVVLAFTCVSLFVQIVTGIAYSVTPGRKETGQGILLSTAILLLLGFCVCGIIVF